MNWTQVIAQAVTVLVGGLAVGAILGLQRFQLERHALIAQRRRQVRLSKADHLDSLIAFLVHALALGGGIYSLNQLKESNDPAAKQNALDELATVAPQYNQAFRDAIVEAERYGMLPDDARLGDLHLNAYVSTILEHGLDRCLGGQDWHAFASARKNIWALIEDLRALSAHEEAAGEQDVKPLKRKEAPPELDLICLPRFVTLLPRRTLTSSDVDTWFLEDLQAAAAAQEQHAKRLATKPKE